MSSDLNTIAYLVEIEYRLYEYFGLFIIIVGTIGNLCNSFVFLCIPSLNKHPNALFLVGSSIGSLCFINIGITPAVIQVMSGINLSARSLFWCKISSWLTYSGGCFSFMCNCFAALGQFLITSPKLKWQRLITHFRAKLMIVSTATIWLLILIPLPIFYYDTQTSATTISCKSSVPVVSIYASYWIIIGYYFLPIIIILILFLLTWYNLKQLLRRRRTLDGAVARMMLIQMSVLLTGGIPAGLYLSYEIATQYSTKTLLRSTIDSVILIFLAMFTYLTSGISFWIFLFGSKTFRKHIKEFILRRKLFKLRIRPLAMSTLRINAP